MTSPDRLVLGIWIVAIAGLGFLSGFTIGRETAETYTVEQVKPDEVEPVKLEMEQEWCDEFGIECESVRLSGTVEVFYVEE